MEAMEMESIESTLGEVSIEKEESLVRDHDGADIVKSETECI